MGGKTYLAGHTIIRSSAEFSTVDPARPSVLEKHYIEREIAKDRKDSSPILESPSRGPNYQMQLEEQRLILRRHLARWEVFARSQVYIPKVLEEEIRLYVSLFDWARASEDYSSLLKLSDGKPVLAPTTFGGKGHRAKKKNRSGYRKTS